MGKLLLYVILALIGFKILSNLPAEGWILVMVAGVVFSIAYLVKNAGTKQKSPTEYKSSPVAAPVEVTQAERQARDVADQIVSIKVEPNMGYTIPRKPDTFFGRWVPQDETIEVGGLTIKGGMVYIGDFSSKAGFLDASMINTSRKVSDNARPFEQSLDYWPSYSEISAETRRSYLLWLAQGRMHPTVDIGYVFMFFYGLERRVLIDAAADPSIIGEFRAIKEEIRRLIGIYGERWPSFRGYASNLLTYLEVRGNDPKQYLLPVPHMDQSFEIPFLLRFIIGQAMSDGHPIPVQVALAWTTCCQLISKRTPAYRCRELFATVFADQYAKLYGAGFTIKPNKTKLKFDYHAASPSLDGKRSFELKFDNIPDVSALSAPQGKLQAVAHQTCELLDPYSRYIGKNEGEADKLQGAILLPFAYWPLPLIDNMHALQARLEEAPLPCTPTELIARFDPAAQLSKPMFLKLCESLSVNGIGVQPDIMAGASFRLDSTRICLFLTPSVSIEVRQSGSMQLSLLMIDVAICAAAATKILSDRACQFIEMSIATWEHIPVNLRPRLLAHVVLGRSAPCSIASLKKRIEPLDATMRESLASFACCVVQADGEATPEQVKQMEKIYGLLGFEAKRAYIDLHEVATSNAPLSAKVNAGFQLDTSKILALKQDTADVSALLSDIFKEQEPEAEPNAIETESAGSILGMDAAHSAFARMLASRASWTRAELDDLASDMELMLDGALEKVNEASLDEFGEALADGDDPVEINSAITQKFNP